MQVIGAGFGRTGTLTLKAALEELGVGPCYHMVEVLWGDTSRLPLWQAAANGEAVDWKAVFEGFESTVDWPGCTFWEPLMEVFPEAKVLLSLRDPESWYESARNSIYAVMLAGKKGELKGGQETPPSPEAFAMISKLMWDGTFHGKFEDKAYAIERFNGAQRGGQEQGAGGSAGGARSEGRLEAACGHVGGPRARDGVPAAERQGGIPRDGGPAGAGVARGA